MRRGAGVTYELKSQRAGNRRRLDQFHRHRIAEPVGRGTADKGVRGFVETEILLPDMARRH